MLCNKFCDKGIYKYTVDVSRVANNSEDID